MTEVRKKLLSVFLCGAVMALPVGASAKKGSKAKLPEWVKPAVHYLVDEGHLDRSSFKLNGSMSRGTSATSWIPSSAAATRARGAR